MNSETKWNYVCPNCDAKYQLIRREDNNRPHDQAFCAHCMQELPAKSGANSLIYKLVESPKKSS